MIKIGQRTGNPLSEIRGVLDALPAERADSARNWAALSIRWRRSLDDRIVRLTAPRNQIADQLQRTISSLPRSE
jgi:MerR family redox-sensitive transcriptional activator SoxR